MDDSFVFLIKGSVGLNPYWLLDWTGWEDEPRSWRVGKGFVVGEEREGRGEGGERRGGEGRGGAGRGRREEEEGSGRGEGGKREGRRRGGEGRGRGERGEEKPCRKVGGLLEADGDDVDEPIRHGSVTVRIVRVPQPPVEPRGSPLGAAEVQLVAF